jgi:hypothetical protein
MTATTRERLRQAVQNTRQAPPRSEQEIVSLALSLSSEYQQSGLTIDDIIDEIRAVMSGRSQGTAPDR